MNGVYDGAEFAVKLQRHRKLTAEQIRDMIRRYEDGESLTAIAESLGVVPSAVHYQLSKRVVLRPYGKGTKHRKRGIMTEKKRQVFYVDDTMHTPNGYVPALVTEDEPGYAPMMGKDETVRPYYWGHDLEVARELCEKVNLERGITPAQAEEIVLSSVRAQNLHDAAEERAHERWENIKHGKGYRSVT